MTDAVTLTQKARPTTTVDGMEVEVFASEQEAHAAFDAVPSYAEQQAAAFVAHTTTVASAW